MKSLRYLWRAIIDTPAFSRKLLTSWKIMAALKSISLPDIFASYKFTLLLPRYLFIFIAAIRLLSHATGRDVCTVNREFTVQTIRSHPSRHPTARPPRLPSREMKFFRKLQLPRSRNLGMEEDDGGFEEGGRRGL